ncbi:DegT/DnrJ/EryC1/StrS family aminotransferase [Gammaproteobacteria bacterium]|nr:DegT/DnrJ/EryC1/StrS family aminotransferase [Gammaproteobacteria bacterium]
MQVPFHAPKRQYETLSKEIDEAIAEVLTTGHYIMGSKHQEFENQFSAYCGVAHGIGVGNGTDALEIALRTAGAEAGNEVLTVANAGMYTTTACLLIGAVPHYVDIDADSMTMCPKSLASAISEKTKAVVVTHLYGQIADLAAIKRVMESYEALLIEDCAQAHGARRNGVNAGSFGDLATFSFYPTKNLGAIGDGGMILTDSEELAVRARLLRQYGWTEKYISRLPRCRNSRLDEMQAAILLAKLPRLDEWNERRREIIGHYRETCTPLGLKFQYKSGLDFVGHLAVARHPKRDLIRTLLAEQGVPTDIHFPLADYQQKAMQAMHWTREDQPNTRSALGEIFSLPCFPELREAEIDHVASSLQKALTQVE